MRRTWRSAVGLAVVCGWLVTLAPPAMAAADPAVTGCAGAPLLDRHRSPDERASLLVAQLTLDEKVQETASMLDATHSRETPPIDRLCVPALRLNNGSAGVS